MTSGSYIGTTKGKISRNMGQVKVLRINRNQSNKDFRLIGGNINTFPVTKILSNEIKRDKLRQVVCSTEAYVVTLSEHNLNLSKIPLEQRPSQIVEGWRKKIITKFGYLETGKDMYGLGGTGIMSLDRAASILMINKA